MMTKQALRAQMRQQKLALTPREIAEKSNVLCRMVLEHPSYRKASAIYGYLPFNQEVNLMPLLQQALIDGKQVALPKCREIEMSFVLVSDLSRVRRSSIGAPEPTDDVPIAQDETALVIVPGLAFDRRGYRIGYGGGYYDQFLTLEPNHPTLAVCYAFQVLPRLEPEQHDIPVQTLLSI